MVDRRGVIYSWTFRSGGFPELENPSPGSFYREVNGLVKKITEPAGQSCDRIHISWVTVSLNPGSQEGETLFCRDKQQGPTLEHREPYSPSCDKPE